MPLTRDEAREALLRRISPDWRCPACEHDRFLISHAFSDLLSRASLESDEADRATTPCLGLVCFGCGHVSLHAVAVLDGTLHEDLAG